MKLNFEIQQNSDEWLEIKVGKFSASTCAELLMDKKTKGYTGLIDRIVEERMTGYPTESKTFKGNQFTERGHMFEPIAREDYEMRNFVDIVQVGVIELDDWVLCSPDGLIDDNGLYQAKCPIFNTQRYYLKIYQKLLKEGLSNNEIVKKLVSIYYKQIQFELFVSGREYNIFNSYHPHLPALDIIVEPDLYIFAEIELRLFEAKLEVENEIKLLKSLR